MAAERQSGDEHPPVSFAQVVGRFIAAVRAVAGTDPDSAAAAAHGPVVDLALTVGPGQPPIELEARFDAVCRQLGLDPLERAVLALCAATEVHPDYAAMFAYLYGDGARHTATPRVIGRLLAGPGLTEADVLVCFDRAAPLLVTGAVRLQGEGPLAERAAVLGGQLSSHLLGSNLHDVTHGGRLRRLDVSPLPLGREHTREQLAALLSHPSELPLLVSGADAGMVLAAAADRGLVMLDAASVADETVCADLTLAALLEGRVPVVDGLDELPRDGRARSLELICALPWRPVFLASRPEEKFVLADRALIVIEVPEPSVSERAAAWHAATGEADVGVVASRFRLDVGRIEEAVVAARAEAVVAGRERVEAAALERGARQASSRRLGEVAEPVAPGPGWDDLVLPERQQHALHLLSSFLTHREQVLHEWHFARIAGERGLTALFAGESGTGKTMAARVIAATARLDLYRIDLAGLFSKWVGETEKNLDRIFRAAHGANAVLLFDEADVVFGKRTEASDASDRYANLETAYLLQRIERYDGVAILTTNLRGNLDDAFVRRLDVVVDFPPPEAHTRRRLWRALLPEHAPLAPDIDLDYLAERYELTGGGIRNCCLAAAFLAAEQGTPITMTQLVHAVAIEYAKLGRLTTPADFERLGSG